MTMREDRNKDWWDERVEAFVDGTLSEKEATEMQTLESVDSLLAREVRMAKQIRTGFKSMAETTVCPDDLTRAIRFSVHAMARKEKMDSVRESIKQFFSGYRRYVVAGAVVVFVALAVLRSPESGPLPAQEVAQALDDVKWSLALLSDMGSDAAGVVRSDVLEPLVIDNIGRSLDVFGGPQ